MSDKYAYNLIPGLRFPDFICDKEWKELLFGKLFTFLPNNTLSRADLKEGEGEGDVYNVHYGDVLIKLNAYTDIQQGKLPSIKNVNDISKYQNARLQDGDVVIADTAEDETVGKCTEIVNTQETIVVSGLHTIPCRPRIKFAQAFLGYYMNSSSFHNRLRHIMQGVKVTSISKSALQNISLTFPESLEEQQKIADCLSSIDSYISSINEKIEQLKAHKKSLIQKLFPQNGKTVPEYRFPEFKSVGVWKEIKFGDVFSRITKRNTPNCQNVLTISAQYGLVSQYDYFHKNIAASDISNYYLIQKGDFAYNKSRSQGYPFGAIKSLRLYDEGVVSTLYICFRIKGDKYSVDFFDHYFETELINVEIGKIAQEGSRNHGLLNISSDDFFNKIVLLIPSPSEQQKIAECLSSIDKAIIYYSQKASLLEQQKKGLIQQLFPKQ